MGFSYQRDREKIPGERPPAWLQIGVRTVTRHNEILNSLDPILENGIIEIVPQTRKVQKEFMMVAHKNCKQKNTQ